MLPLRLIAEHEHITTCTQYRCEPVNILSALIVSLRALLCTLEFKVSKASAEAARIAGKSCWIIVGRIGISDNVIERRVV